jgi:hypothetical protein
MGSKSISQDEKFAFAVVESVLGVHVEPKDVDGAPGVIDAELRYAAGRRAALEVSSIGPTAEAQIAATLNGKQWRTVAGLELSWHVSVPRNFAPKQLSKIGPALLRCEELQATDLITRRETRLQTNFLTLGSTPGRTQTAIRSSGSISTYSVGSRRSA